LFHVKAADCGQTCCGHFFMKKINNIILNGAANRPFALDVIFTENGKQKPVVIFAHGFKGFKDWGHWEAIGEAFATAGFVFVKFNFSHNGVTMAW